MWQRKQTVFLLLAVILGVVALSVRFCSWVSFVILLFASALDLYTIFLYKRRPLQARLCLVSIVAYVAWYVVFAILSQQAAPDAPLQLSWADAMPIVCAMLTVLARKSILADERLVRAADRLR